MKLDRRGWLAAVSMGGLLAQPLAWAQPATRPDAVAPDPAAPQRLAACWRGAAADSPQHVGILELQESEQVARIAQAVRLPGRAHGLTRLPDGSVLVVAVRPGRWLLRLWPGGQVQTHRLEPFSAAEPTHLNGHAAVSADGRWFYTTETSESDGQGWIARRDARTLDTISRWPTGGIEPHDLKLHADGSLWIAHGGIRRGPQDSKLALDRMASQLTRMDAAEGRITGRWHLPDARLSLRHLAFGEDGSLGVALQAEHEAGWQRQQAPTLAVWRDDALTLPTASSAGMGYAGDICAAPGGGYVLSNHTHRRALLWRPETPAALVVIAELEQAYALAEAGHRVLIAAARGVGRWSPEEPPRAWRWPEAMALDNHWIALPQPA